MPHHTGAGGRSVHPRRHRARARAALGAALAGAAGALALAACGGSPAPAAAPPRSDHAYMSCLLQRLDGDGGQGARRACKSLKPAGGVAPLLIQFTSCLSAHGVALPAGSPTPETTAPASPGASAGSGTGTGAAATPGTASPPAGGASPTAGQVLQFLNTVRLGSPAQQAAFQACESSV